jgi:hypothetical protein
MLSSGRLPRRPRPRLNAPGFSTPPTQVLSYDPASGTHHVLYLDGEHEWADLAREALVWLREPQPGGGVSAGAVGGAARGAGPRAGALLGSRPG